MLAWMGRGGAQKRKVSATFNEAIDPATVTAASFVLVQGTAGVSGTVAASGSTATFKPGTALPLSGVYKATLTTDIKDLAGNNLPAAYSWQVTITRTVDTTPPTVSS